VKLLLDTNVAIWLAQGARERVSPAARRALEDPANTLLGSAASFWEIAIKRSLGKLDVEDRWPEVLHGLSVGWMPVTPAHARGVEHLPWHHRDPFDRLLVAQALVEGTALVSADARLSRYGVRVVW